MQRRVGTDLLPLSLSSEPLCLVEIYYVCDVITFFKRHR